MRTETKAEELVLTKHQTFVYRELRRSEIKGAPYNARKIDPESRSRLKSKIQQVGLIETPIVNKRTGNLVSGHQRLDILDQLERGKDYLIGVSEIDVDESKEAELNVFLNNAAAQGYFDRDAFMSMLDIPGFTLEGAGFTPFDLEMEFGELPAPLAEAIELEQRTSQALADEGKKLAEGRHDAEQPQGPEQASVGPIDLLSLVGLNGDAPAAPEDPSEKLRKRKREWRNKAQNDPAQDADYFVLIVFRSRTDKEAFLTHQGLDPNARFVMEEQLRNLLTAEARNWKENLK